ncbi:hypothetical protein Taro_027703 [Colocasia esculenta]|uniref:Uncharacterized protein n=1 Tax=Colocasia esculenta TaxID=4460 RepID=A0A843VGG2_COLES|nr:hypothetical protein [Colocasia esculenta]
MQGRYQPTIGKKRPSGGVNEPAEKKPKELGKQIVVATGERLELLRRRRKARNPKLHPLHSLLHPERRLGTSVDTTWASVDTQSKNSPEGGLGRPLVSTPLGLVSTHCPRLARRCSGSCL